MKENNDLKRLKNYSDFLNESKTGILKYGFEYKVKIGDYAFSRLRYLEDIYNNSYIEKNVNYIFNSKQIPYEICSTFAGNAQEGTKLEIINKNDNLLQKLKEILIVIYCSKKMPFSLKYKKVGLLLEEALNKCFEENVFSKISLKNVLDRNTFDKMVKYYENKLTDEQKQEYNQAFVTRDYLTKEEYYNKAYYMER